MNITDDQRVVIALGQAIASSIDALVEAPGGWLGGATFTTTVMLPDGRTLELRGKPVAAGMEGETRQ